MWRYFLAATERPLRGITPPWLLLFVLLLAGAIPAPQSLALSNSRLSGVVLSEDGAVVPEAEISIAGTALKTVSNTRGYFAFEHVPPGNYQLEISSPGFETVNSPTVEVHPDLPATIQIHLERESYYLGKFNVRAKREFKSIAGMSVVTRKEIEADGAASIPELLENQEGLFLQKSGPQGRTQVRIRGSRPEQVLVLLDGQKLNNTADGQADLSGIPLEMVERVEIYRGGASARFGPDALAGVINIITRPQTLLKKIRVEGQSRFASWDTEEYRLTARDIIPSDRLSLKLGGHWRRTAGNYDFSYRPEGSGGTDTVHSGTRINNAIRGHDIFLTGLYRISRYLALDFSGQLSSTRQGLPDRATRQNQFAHSRENHYLAGTSLIFQSLPTEIKLDLNYSRYDQRFIDTTSEPVAIRFNTRFENDIYTARLTGRRTLWTGSQLDLGTEHRRDRLHHDDIFRPSMSIGQTRRLNTGLFAVWEQKIPLKDFLPIGTIACEAAGRYDISVTERDSLSAGETPESRKSENFSPHFGLGISQSGILSYAIRGSYGHSYRLPELNALFWKGDVRAAGNPNLRPEKSEHSQIEAEINLKLGLFDITGGMEYFHSHVVDLIIWQPNFQGVWQPQNLAAAQITGRSDRVTLALGKDILKCRFQNGLTTALNRVADPNQYGRQLVFFPHYITTLGIDFKYRLLSLSYNIRWVDEVFVNNANTRSYPAYRLDDFGAALTVKINHRWQVLTRLEVDNIRDVDYVLMPHYPMPGRLWGGNIEVKYGVE